MATVGWFIMLVVLPALAAAQLAVLVVAGRRIDYEANPPADAPEWSSAGPLDATPDGAFGPSNRCPSCGVENDDAYRYCRECVASLTGA